MFCFLFWNAVWKYIQPSFRYLWWFVFEFQNILSKIFYLENSLWILCYFIWFIAWIWTLNMTKAKYSYFHLNWRPQGARGAGGGIWSNKTILVSAVSYIQTVPSTHHRIAEYCQGIFPVMIISNYSSDDWLASMHENLDLTDLRDSLCDRRYR